MPKHSESSPFSGYLSADDLLHTNYQFTNSQVYWLKNYVRLWNILDNTWFDKSLEEQVLAEDLKNHGVSSAHEEVK